MKYKLLKSRIVFDRHFRIHEVEVQYDRFNNAETITSSRLIFDRGDSTAVLLYETDTNKLLLTRQFRVPATFHGDDWLLEIVAGRLEEGEDPEMCIRREVEEEIGYKIDVLQPISTFYTSPGGSTERMLLFYAETTSSAKIYKGGGAAEENEDILLEKYSPEEIDELISNKVRDGKSLVALLWFKVNRL